MKLFVTGATGFVGRALCRVATARGHEVLGLHRESTAALPPGCRSAVGALASVPWPVIEGFRPDAVVHAAWIATPGVYLTSPENSALVEQSQAMLRGLIDRGVKHVAAVGTCLEYAASTQPLDEERSAIAPSFPYSMEKVRLHEWLSAEAGRRAAASTWFRLFYPYGVGEHAKRLPTELFQHLRRGEALFLKTPRSVKDYIYIDDVASGICHALETRLIGAVNLGSGRGVSIDELARRIATTFGFDPALVRHADAPGVDAMPVAVANIAKLRSTGWSPDTSLDEGLRRLAASLS
jgi:dTDP-6-deoxy-L-talose 4-dehydrogenase (NAD+)